MQITPSCGSRGAGLDRCGRPRTEGKPTSVTSRRCWLRRLTTGRSDAGTGYQRRQVFQVNEFVEATDDLFLSTFVARRGRFDFLRLRWAGRPCASARGDWGSLCSPKGRNVPSLGWSQRRRCPVHVSGSVASWRCRRGGSLTSCCRPADALGAISDTDEGDVFGAVHYTPGMETDGLSEEAVMASLGCGNPLALADLRDVERVLDLGSVGGIDLLLSARTVGPIELADGMDMTDKMLNLAKGNAAKAGATDAKLMKGQIEDITLPDSSIDMLVSNCVINLSTAETTLLGSCSGCRHPLSGGIYDAVAEDQLSSAGWADRGSFECAHPSTALNLLPQVAAPARAPSELYYVR